MTTDDRPQKLWELCEAFIKKQQIICAEATVEDRVYEHAPELVEAICEIVGYHRDPDDEEDEDEAPSPRPGEAYNPTAHRIGEKPITVFEDGV